MYEESNLNAVKGKWTVFNYQLLNDKSVYMQIFSCLIFV